MNYNEYQKKQFRLARKFLERSIMHITNLKASTINDKKIVQFANDFFDECRKLQGKIDDMFGEINYCHECKFFVGGYCNGEKRNPDEYACLKFEKKRNNEESRII